MWALNETRGAWLLESYMAVGRVQHDLFGGGVKVGLEREVGSSASPCLLARTLNVTASRI
jgi:hypothetical protein